MGRTLKLFLKQKTTIIGIVMMLFFQLIFSLVWMNGYDGISDRITNFRVGVVSEDKDLGGGVADTLMQTLPFQMERFERLDDGRELLDRRDLAALIHIPAGFTAQVEQVQGEPKFEVLVNESNPAMVKSVGQQLLSQLTMSINSQFTQRALNDVLKNAGLGPAEVESVTASVNNRIKGDLVPINPLQNFSYQMMPMMLVLASYVGAMLLAMNLTVSSKMVELQGETTRWQRFLARQVLNVVAVTIVSLVMVGILFMFDIEPAAGLVEVFGFLFLSLIAFVAVSQSFLFLFGEAGMILNIIALSMQLATSGAMVPRELLSETFHSIGTYLPATYGVLGNFNLLFGGTGTSDAVESLLWITAGALAVAMVGVSLRKDKPAFSGQKVVATNE